MIDFNYIKERERKHMVNFKADSIEEISEEKLLKLIENHYSIDVPKYQYLYDLYKGKHEIREREVGENKPNNKIEADFYGKLIDTEVGYFLGKPIVFNSMQDKALDELGNILIDSEFDELIMEVGKEGGIKGKSYILLYQDEDSLTRLDRLSPNNVICVESKRGRGEIGVAIRVYTETQIGEGGAESDVIFAEIYDKDRIAYRKIEGNNIAIDNRIIEGGEDGHIFGVVPIFKFANNEEEMGSFEKVITMVNAYDKLLSDSSNEHEAYRNAYLVLKNMLVDKEGEKKLADNGIIHLFDDGEAYFLKKEIQDSAISSHLDRLEKDIHNFSDIPNMSDEAFAGNLSGVAIRFKLLGLENKCIIKERKLTKTIRRLLKAVNIVLKTKVGEEIDTTKVGIIFTRNIPNNLQEIVDSVVKLNGIVDKETLLSLLPFVDSPAEILEKLEAETDDRMQKDMNKVFDNIDNSNVNNSIYDEDENVDNVGDNVGSLEVE